MNIMSLFGSRKKDGNGSVPASGARPIHVDAANFDEVVLGSGQTPVLVDFWAEWCGPCRMVAPVLDELAKELDGKAVVAKLDVDESPRLASRYGVRGIPTLAIFQNGEIVDTLVGVQPKRLLAQRVLDRTT